MAKIFSLLCFVLLPVGGASRAQGDGQVEHKATAASAIETAGARGAAPAFESNQLSKQLRFIPMDRVSSGALRLLDNGGNLVRPPPALDPGAARPALSSDPSLNAGLDPRVGLNIRLGNDPSQLPSSQRAQAEPHIARHPTNPDFLAATFQEGRYNNGAALDCGYAISHDGGLSWSRALIPGLTPIVGGPYTRASDPVAGIALDGAIYLNTIGLLDATLTTSALLLNRSTNGGASFDPPIEVLRSPNSSIFLDKNWMAIDTLPGTPRAGRILLTLTRFDPSFSPIVSTFSDDRGKTWSPVAFVTPANYSAQGSQPVFLADGKLAVVFWHFSPSDRLEMALSTNGGNTFNSPQPITLVTRYDAPGIRDGATLPSATADRTTGHLLVTYQGMFQGQPRILFTKSADAGATWTPAIPISDNPTNTPVFNPAIAVSPDAQVVSVAFYDGRMNPGNPNLIDLFLACSFDGGNNWQPNLRLTTVSSDVRLAPLTSAGYMLGDYQGVAPSTSLEVPAVPVWVDTRTGNPDPFVTRVGMSPQVSFGSWRAARFSLNQINDPTQGAANADPEGDRLVNLLEYAFGLNPWLPDHPAMSASFSRAGATATCTVSYERLRGASDLTYSWSSSANLRNWTTALPVNTVVTANPARQTETVTSTFRPVTNAHQFFRVGVVSR